MSTSSGPVMRTSIGTVKVRGAGNANEVVFAPDDAHLAINGENKYAVFFDEDSSGDNHNIRKLDIDNRGTLLKLKTPVKQALLFTALSAATTGVKMEITVDVDFNITSITVPAR